MKKKFPIITKKVILFIVLADLTLCFLMFATSYVAYNRHFRAQYDTTVRQICSAARECLNPDDFAKYKMNPVPDETYEKVRSTLQAIVDKFDLNVIYVSAVEAPDYRHIFYFYDPVNDKMNWEAYPLGFTEDYVEPGFNLSTKKVFEGGATIVRHTIKTRSGSHITAQMPVFNSAGKIVAVIGAQKNIQEFVNARRSFIRFVVLTALFLTTAFAMIFATYFNELFIKPILFITYETDRFASYSGSPSKDLLEGTTRDELGTLARSVYKMEESVASNIELLTRMTTETALALASAIDAKDKYTHGHSTRVADYSLSIARASGKSAAECRDIYLAALLHDVGKIGIPSSIINKPGKLTDEEFQMIKTHPVIGRQILTNISQTPHIAEGAYYHHERYDGKGYPEGLSGRNIPDIGRIIAVADAYDAMTSNRSYRDTLSQDMVRREIENGVGSQFDPEYARVMLVLIDKDIDYRMREN